MTTIRALIIVDMQNDYFAGGKFPLVGIDAATANAARVLEITRAAGDLVVHVRHESLSADAAFFVLGPEGAQITNTMQNRDGEHVIVKNQINAFHGLTSRAFLTEIVSRRS